MDAESRTNNGNPAAAADPADAVAAFWAQWLEQSSRGTQVLLEALQAGSDPKRIQQLWMDAAAQSLDRFMRTPAFLEMMRRQLKAITDAKRMQDQVVHGAARQLGMPLADDVAGLFERLRSTEREILSRLEAIEGRLEALARAEPPGGNRKRRAEAAEEPREPGPT